jgi:signal transduction histidine kinase
MKIVRFVQNIGVRPELDAGLMRRVLLLNMMGGMIILCIFPYIFIFWTISPLIALLSLCATLLNMAVMLLNHMGRLTASRHLFVVIQPLTIGVFSQLFGPSVALENLLFVCAIYPVLLFEWRQWRDMLPGISGSIAYYYALALTSHTPLPGLPRFELNSTIKPFFFYSFNGIGFLLLISGVMYLSWLYTRAEAQREETIRELLEANEARERADEASEAKSRFLANMSHELRTPLNAIIGYAGLIEEELEDESPDVSGLREDILKVGGAGRHLLAIVSDILDLSKIEASEMTVRVERVSLVEVFGEISAQAAPLVAARGNRWRAALGEGVDVIETDRMRLAQILLNLVSNAAKFTERGEISLVGERGAGWVTLTVRDTGVGIAAEQQERIFEAFVQADDSFTRTHQGTGLGLTLSRRFAQMLGGTLTLESAPGEGSAFVVTLPV